MIISSSSSIFSFLFFSLPFFFFSFLSSSFFFTIKKVGLKVSSGQLRAIGSSWLLGEEELVFLRNVTSAHIPADSPLYSCTHMQHLPDLVGYEEKKKRGNTKLGGNMETGDV